ncbi:hypothetical protein FRB96_008371 [Tulasnella sp. 330]|nr:hypothetical protein FRB96_008371 [Tulasnella sp. 330]
MFETEVHQLSPASLTLTLNTRYFIPAPAAYNASKLLDMPPPRVSRALGPTKSMEEEEVHVLVTGYGPFLEAYPINSSWSVASNLPSVLPTTATHPTQIRVHVHPSPIRVSWSAVREIVPKLHAQNYDIMLHIGLAAGRTYFTMERLAYRDRFDQKTDVDGAKIPAEEVEKLWEGVPTTLRPTFRCDDVWRRWKSLLADPTMEIRPSDDPGNYLCGFIYYSSLAYCFMKGEEAERPIMFMHVPDLQTESQIKSGVDVAIALIRALVESMKGNREGEGDDQAPDPVKMGEYPETWATDQVRDFA